VFDADAVLLVWRARVACPECGPEVEALDWLEPHARVTNRLAESLARMDPELAQASREAVQHFITDSKWSYEALLRGVREYSLPILLRTGPMEAWIVDDTAYPKSGKHSVGVARQYCGVKGKQDNGQDAVSVPIATNQVPETSNPAFAF